MQIIPAIDLRAGRVVRLLRGDFEQETVYATDPVEVAERWRDQGGELLHVVDLDGVREGHPVQLEIARAIARVAPIELSGGMRTAEAVEEGLAGGAHRVIIGTGALDLDLVTELLENHADHLVVALDARAGRVVTEGWTEGSGWKPVELARELLDLGVLRFMHTDVERDGTLTAPNYRSLEQLIDLGAPVIASGGVSSVEDIDRLREMGAEAAIVGRALYEGRLKLEEAIAHAR